MFDSQCDLAALVYEPGQDPDPVLSGFAADLDAAGHHVAGLVQLSHRRLDASLSATLLHSGEQVSLFRSASDYAGGPRLDVGGLRDAGERIAGAIDQGADLVIVNRFGRQESAGKGLSFVIRRALDADVPVVIAVPGHRFAEWIRFAEGMSVKLHCDRAALDAWWHGISGPCSLRGEAHRTVCEILK